MRTDFLLELASRDRLVPTGGSDYHGPGPAIGAELGGHRRVRGIEDAVSEVRD